MCILALTSPQPLRRRRRACNPVTQSEPPMVRLGLDRRPTLGIEAMMRTTVACGRSEEHMKFHEPLNGTTAILIDVETAWTLRTMMTSDGSVGQKRHDLTSLKDNAIAGAAGGLARRRILDKCILALTSPEPRLR